MKKIVSRVAFVAILASIAWVINHRFQTRTSPEVVVVEEPVVQAAPEVQAPAVAQTAPAETNELQARITGISFGGSRR